MASVMVQAFGKINLYLQVLGKRDDGYHEVDMVMQSVRLSDTIYLRTSRRMRIFVNHPYVPRNHHNLAYKAGELMKKTYHLPPFDISIDKKIPVSAGMAGGSTDAAAVLVGLNELFHLGLSAEILEEHGASLGSDVPFCVQGHTQRARGRGEQLSSLTDLAPLYVLVLPQDFGVSTAKVYQEYKPLSMARSSDGMLKALEEKNQDQILNYLSNDLETTTFSLYPKIKKIRDTLKNFGARHVLMSGSGPTMLAFFLDFNDAWSVYKRMVHKGHRAMLTTTTTERDFSRRIRMV